MVSPVLIKERYETLRSQLSFLYSTVKSMKQTFWLAYNSTIYKVPPFIFPFTAFRNLESNCLYLKKYCEEVNANADIRDTLRIQSILEKRSNILYDVLIRMQISLSQRIAGTGTMRLTDFHLISQFEQGTIMKAYQALDAFSFDLVKHILGVKWMEKNSYTPLSIFGSIGYSIDTVSYVSSIPYEDTFRTRFWPIMSHEISHILLQENVKENGKLKELLINMQEQIMNGLLWPNEAKENALLQAQELFCDIISAYVCPCAFITSSLKLSYIYENENESNSLIEKLPNFSHPPSDVRIIAMRVILEENGIIGIDNILKKYVETTLRFHFDKNMKTLASNSQDLLFKYIEIAGNITESVLEVLNEMPITSFDSQQWGVIQNDKSDLTSFSPIFLINYLWIRRLKTIAFDNSYDLRRYYTLRYNEPQMLEFVIDRYYKYYIEKVIPKSRQIISQSGVI